MADNNDIPLITINFTYNDQLITLKSSIYKTLSELKILALKKYDTINNKNTDTSKLHCYYLGRDLHECENERIASIFSNREKLTIKIMPPKNHSSTLSNNISNNKQKYFSSVFKNENVFSTGFNNIGVIKKPIGKLHLNDLVKKRLRDNSEKILSKNNDSMQKFKTILSVKSKGKLYLDTENNNSLNLSRKKKPKASLTIENERNVSEWKCEKCNSNKINYYCRICNRFLCSNCKNSTIHKNHLMIHLDKNNLNDNINIYGSVIQTDIEENINNNNNLIDKENCVEGIKSNDLLKKNSEVIEKLENLVKIYSNVIQILKNYFYKEAKNKMNDLFLNYNDESSKINENIKNILTKIEGNKKKITYKEFKNYFGILNSNEVKLNNLNNNLSKYYLCSEINSKVYSIYDKINHYLAEIIDSENLFCLEQKYSTELLKLMNDDKDDNKSDSNNDKNNNINKATINTSSIRIARNVSLAERNKLKSNLKKKNDTIIETNSNSKYNSNNNSNNSSNNNSSNENSSINNDTEKIYNDLHLFTEESSNYGEGKNNHNCDDESSKSKNSKKNKKRKKTKSEDLKKEKKSRKNVRMKTKKSTKKYKKEE